MGRIEQEDLLVSLTERGRAVLDAILPYECVQTGGKNRLYDAALLFLLFPLEVVRNETVAPPSNHVPAIVGEGHDSQRIPTIRAVFTASMNRNHRSKDTTIRPSEVARPATASDRPRYGRVSERAGTVDWCWPPAASPTRAAIHFWI